MKFSYILSRILTAFLLLPGPASFAADDGQLKDLKTRADKVLADTDNVRASKESRVVFEYATALETLGQSNAALAYLERGLTYSPWRLEEQLRCARLLRVAGREKLSQDKARLILQRGETDALLIESSKLLEQSFDPTLRVDPWPDAQHSLALVPLGEVDTWLVRSLQTNLSNTLKIPVIVRQATLGLPSSKRDPLHALADRCREPLRTPANERIAKTTAEQLGLPPTFTTNDDAVFKVFRELLRKESEERNSLESVRRFDEELIFTRRLGKQWQADELLLEVERALASERKGGQAFLAISRFDLFAGESRYVFGFGDSRVGGAVMSYLRFTAALMDQPPDREKLSKRAYKQALSSVGFALGVARCSNPSCPRAYPNSLEEHDAKGVQLCEQCDERLHTALRNK